MGEKENKDNRESRETLVKKRRKRLRRRFLKFLLSLLLIATATALWNLPFWRYDGLASVRGNRLVSAEAIIKKIEAENIPLFRIDPAPIQARIETIPEIESAKVRRWLFPARIEIQVSERIPLARVASQSVFLDLAGVRFSAPPQPVALSVLLPEPYDSQSAELFRQLAAHWPPEATGTLDLRQPGDLRVNLSGTEVRLGKFEKPGELEEKLRTFYRLLPLAERYRNRLEYVDLRYPEAPTLKCKLSDHQACKETGRSPLPSSPSP